MISDKRAGPSAKRKAELKRLSKRIPGYDPWASKGTCRFDYTAADNALQFFDKCLTHVKGKLAKKPFTLELWQAAIIVNLFGWKRGDGTRRYRECLMFVPRKNGKTTFAGGIVNLVLFTDGEPGGENYSAAAKRDQAKHVFEQVVGMIANDEALCERAEVCKYSVVVGGSSYKAICAEAKTSHGFNTHLAVIDELHAQPNRELVDAIETSMGTRSQPLMLHITTSDYERESICNEKHDYAGKVRDGIIQDETFLPVIFEASIDDDWTDPRVWAKANPNLGVSLSYEYMAGKCEKAKNSPAFENTFKRLHLNIRTEQETRWLAMEHWDACGGEVDPDELKGRVCYGGLDLSSTQDITALVLLFPQTDSEPYRALPFFWIPEWTAQERERRGVMPSYLQWKRDGYITLSDGKVIDYQSIRSRVNELAELYDIKEIACDRWNASQIITDLDNDGHTIFPIGQGFASMASPTKRLEELVIGHELAHGDNPILRWMASNVVVKTDEAGNMKPNKAKCAEKIDGITALLNALGRAMTFDPDAGGSVYDKRGVLWA